MSDGELTCYRDRFGVAQRRRAEALILVRILWPHVSAETARHIAAWVIVGDSP